MAEPLDGEAFCLGQNAPLIRLLTLYCGDVEVARDLTQETLAPPWVHSTLEGLSDCGEGRRRRGSWGAAPPVASRLQQSPDRPGRAHPSPGCDEPSCRRRYECHG